MTIGILSDPHCGFHRGTKVTAEGVNQREQDFYDAFEAAVRNLVSAGVEAIVDLGDLAEVPHPRKRAILQLIRVINDSGLPWYSAAGNHTLTKTSVDVDLYDVLAEHCPRFNGATSVSMTDIGVALIAHDYDPDVLRSRLEWAAAQNPIAIGGHFNCDDVPYGGNHVTVDELPDVPVFLGHYHKRQETWRDSRDAPVLYVGATERSKWDEATNPTGAAIYDGIAVDFIDHPARQWIDLQADADTYLDVLDRDLEGAIVRLTIDASPEQYQALDSLAARRKAKGALEFKMRRAASAVVESSAAVGSPSYSLIEDWQSHMAGVKLPKGVSKQDVQQIGLDAIRAAQEKVA